MRSPSLQIRLLGDLDLRRDAEPLTPIASARAASLLAYLLLHREAPQPRQRLAFLLWPDSSEAQARTNLRHLLHTLRGALPEADRFLEATTRTLRWRADAPCWLDVAAFEELAGRAEGDDPEEAVAALRQAADLYAGDLLEGCDDEWLAPERERLRRRRLEVLERLVGLLEERGEHAEAVAQAERLLGHDPLREESHRLLMRLHAAHGDRALALRAYHRCAAALERELGVEPAPPTREAYEALLAEEGAPAREEAEEPAGAAPLVGRAIERERLMGLWRAGERGRAQLALVTGEPGIGKTRLVEELRDWCARRGAAVAEARCYPAEGALAYGPLAAWLRSQALAARVRRLDRGRLGELARLLPELLEEPGVARPEPLPEADQRHRLFDAAAAALTGPGPPLLLVADDLHWCDRESLRFLHYLLRAAPGARLLVAATARREEMGERHPLAGLAAELRARERCEAIELARLGPAQTVALAERLAGRPLGRARGERLHAATEGNPLFVVEAVRAGWEPERGGPLSPRLEAAIAARLDQLSDPARELAGLAATVGREFTAAVLGAAGEDGDEDLVRALDELWRRRLVREHGADGYDFSHGEIREVAYRSLGPARRRSHHLRVAEALERLNADDPAAVAGQVAWHYESAGAPREAVAWYERAAEAAQRLHASREAVRLLDRAIELLRALPESPARSARELALLAALPGPLTSIEGYSSQRLVDLHERALALAGGLAVEPSPPLLRSIALTSLSRARLEDARRAGERLAALAARDGDPVLTAEGAYVLGIAAFWSGELASARRHFEAAVAACRPEDRVVHLLHYGMDPEVLCRGRLAMVLWFLGMPEAASRTGDATLALADEIGHPLTRGVALVFAAHLALEQHDQERLRACAAALRAGRGDWVARHVQLAGVVFGGYVEVLDGRGPAGVARIARALEGAPHDHAPGMQSLMARVLLEACATAGEARAGLTAVERALGAGVGADLWEAETRRLWAEFLSAVGAPAEQIDGELGRALEVARRQGALGLELRVAASRLRRGIEGARADLAAVLDRLPEGRETADARDAAALLAG